MKKNVGTKRTINLDEFKRHTGVLIDHMDDRFKAVDEQFKMVGEQFKMVDKQFKTVDEQFKTVGAQFDAQNEVIAQMMVDPQEIKSGLKKKVDYDDFAKLEKRVVRIEARLHA
ncbi:MAG TPA: hypothetical protein VI953_02440 [Candidatus Paceibacterota bacterium]